MAFTLDNIVPWGRTYDEYVAMFSLTPTDLSRSILGCGDGPAGFNAVATANGGQVVSFDPLYAFSAAQIASRIATTRATVLEQLDANRDAYVWTSIRSLAELDRLRTEAMSTFLADYAAVTDAGRYLVGELPALSFADRAFDLALSSHLLFLYSDHLDHTFHLQALAEMLRVASEVRVFPLLTLAGLPSPHLTAVISALADQSYAATIERVEYEFQRGGDQMLRITRA